MTARHQGHLTNGVAPVRGCAECAALIRSAKRNAEKTPDGRMPPWVWDDDKEDR